MFELRWVESQKVPAWMITVYKDQRPSEDYVGVLASVSGSKDSRLILSQSKPSPDEEPAWERREFAFIIQRSGYREAKALVRKLLSHSENQSEGDLEGVQQKLMTIERGQGSLKILHYTAIPGFWNSQHITESIRSVQFEVKVCFPVTAHT